MDRQNANSMAISLGVKLCPPPKCDGETDFERFTKLLNAYLGCGNPDYVTLLESAVEERLPITPEVLQRLADAHQRSGRQPGVFALLNHILYYVLISLTEKSAFTIVDNVESSNGMGAWRRLNDRYSRTQRQKSVMSLVAIMGMKLPDDHSLKDRFVKFETELDRYEKATGDRLPETANIGILVAVTTGRLQNPWYSTWVI